jgi:hypothetical protein
LTALERAILSAIASEERRKRLELLAAAYRKFLPSGRQAATCKKQARELK